MRTPKRQEEVGAIKQRIIAGSLCLQVAFAAWAEDARPPMPGMEMTDPIRSDAQVLTDDAMPSRRDAGIPLFLAVILNGRETGLLGEFTWFPETGRLAATAAELRQLGLAPPRPAAGLLMLDAIPGLSYDYDEAAQSISFSARPDRLARRIIKGRHRPAFSPPQPGYGAVLNYRLTSNLGSGILDNGFHVDSFYSALEGRLYSPFGVLKTTGSVSARNFSLDGARFQRNETTYSFASPRTMVTYNAGDIITSGPSWTRPIRMGGIQVQRDFSLRGDVVTDPQLSYSGTAAVPTSVDVYVNNLNAWSGTVTPGPFTLTDLPTIGDRGDATIVIRDDSGHEETKTVSFFATETLMAPGQLDFSLETGVARRRFGTDNSVYGSDRMASASLRYGLNNRLTFQGHFEGSSELAAASAGISSVLFNRAELGISLGGSRFQGKTGYLGHIDLRTEIAGVDVRVSSTRHSDDYADLAYATALAENGGEKDPDLFRPDHARDVISLSAPFFSDLSTVGVNLINLERNDTKSTILSGSFSRRMKWKDAHMRVSGFKDFAGSGYGLSAGVSIPLGRHASMSSTLRRDQDGAQRGGVRLHRFQDLDIGSHGYSAEMNRDDEGGLWGRADGSYRTRYGVAEARLQRMTTGQVSAAAGFEGAVVVSNAGVIAGNRINDGFAVVDLGIRNVPVMLHNQPVGKTGPGGKALVPGLIPYRKNRVSVAPEDLPLRANVNATAMQVVPARESGVTLRMGRGGSAVALIVLSDGAGRFIPVGSEVRVNGRRSEFFVGYDGEVWLEKLQRRNRVEVETGAGGCVAEFPMPDEGKDFLEVECR